jgi:membrane-associated phospholipid phosphatase
MDAARRPRRLELHLRLEDAVAGLFFVIFLFVLVAFHVNGGGNLGPATDMALAGVVALCLKQLFEQVLSKKEYRVGNAGAWGEFARPYGRIARDWFPFVLILMMYYSLYGDATHLLVRQDRDAWLIAADQRLLGFEPTLAIQRWITPGLTAWMKFSYGMHLLYIPLVAGFIYVRRARDDFRRMMCGLVLICLFGFLGYLLIPAVGPMYTLASLYRIPLAQTNAFINHQAAFMDFARIQRDAFPSMHVGISFLIWLYAWKYSKRLGWILSPFVLSLWVSTVYLRYHYFVDCLAGFVLAPACYWIANRLFSRYREMTISLPVPEKFAGWAHKLFPARPGDVAGNSGSSI